MGTVVPDFYPRDKIFCFHLTKDTCHEKRTGKCSLKDNVSSDRCIKILNSWRSSFEMTPVDLVKYRCGHYDFTDGQHRTCIAIKLNKTLPVIIYNDSRLCIRCRNH